MLPPLWPVGRRVGRRPARVQRAFPRCRIPVAVIKPLRPEIAWVQLLAGSDVISEPFYERAKRAAMAEPTPPSSPVCFVSEDPSGAVIVDEPDLAALIHFHTCVAICRLVEEAPPVIANDSNHLVNLLGTLLLQDEFAFFGHE